MAYVKQTWTDRQVARPLTFATTTNTDGTITLSPSPGTVTSAGTLFTAERMNHIEDGIYNLSQTVDNLQSVSYSILKGEITLENTDNVSITGSLNLTYPVGFNATNCVCIALGVTGSPSSSTHKDYFTFGYLNDKSTSYVSGALRSKISLLKDNMSLTISYDNSPAPATQTRKYIVVLMRIDQLN